MDTLHHYVCMVELAETDAMAVTARQSWVWGQGGEERKKEERRH
jgi:hypothetical protein